MGKKRLYFDMDNVLVDFQSGIDRIDEQTKKEYEGRLDDVPGIFSLMNPTNGAIEAVHKLAEKYDVYILSTAPWKNPSAWSDKLEWVKKHFGEGKDSVFYKRLIISHHKDFCKGDYLIDDREKNGADKFEGELILFKSEKFPNWQSILDYLLQEDLLEKAENLAREAHKGQKDKSGNDYIEHPLRVSARCKSTFARHYRGYLYYSQNIKRQRI